MKHVILVCFFLIFYSCTNQKKIIPVENNCEVVSATPEIIHSQYLSFFEDCKSCEKELEKFSKIKKGILLYRWVEGIGSNQFLIVDLEKGFTGLRIRGDSIDEVNFLSEEKKNLNSIVEVLQKGNYYQTCKKYVSHSAMTLLIVRSNNEEIVQYFSPFFSLHEVNASDTNVNSIKELFGILSASFYR